MAATTTARRPQQRHGGASAYSSSSSKTTTKTITKTITKTAMAAATPFNGSRIRPSDPRLKLSLRDFHQIEHKKQRPHQVVFHGDIFTLLAAAAASIENSTETPSPTSPPPHIPLHTQTGPVQEADIPSASLYDPGSPWGVRGIAYDPALPLPQGVAFSECESYPSLAARPAPVQPRPLAPSPYGVPPPQREIPSYGPCLRGIMSRIPLEVPVRVPTPPPSTPSQAMPVIKQDPHVAERNGYLTDNRFILTETPTAPAPRAATATTTVITTIPVTTAPTTANGKRRRKPSIKAQLWEVTSKPATPITPVVAPVVTPVAAPVVTPIAPPTIPHTSPISTSRPPTNGRCCPMEVPMILHMILDQTTSSLKPHMVDQYREHIGSLCAGHLAKYRRLKESMGQSTAIPSPIHPPEVGGGPTIVPPTPAIAKTATPSKRKKKSEVIAPPAPQSALQANGNAYGRPVVKAARDDAYRRQMRDEIQHRLATKLGAETTHGGVTNRVIYNLLGVAKHPNADPSKGPIDVHLLTGDEAHAMLDAGSPNEPVVTEREQMFQWRPQLRPIAELFRRMENLDRRVSVQVPSRHCMDDSFESRDLTQVRDRFLAPRPPGQEGEYDDDPWNILDLRSPLPAAVLPRFLTNENCQLLPRLRDEVLNPSRAERDTAAREQWNEWRDVLEWVLLSQGGHNTSPHTDSHGLGTWITVQEGLFGFGWLSHPTPDERAAWTANPHDFQGGKWCFLILEPGQTIFFNSGTVHFVFRLRSEPTLALGGHVLQWSGIERWLSVVAAQMQNPHITNEDMEWSAPKYVRVVARLVEARLARGSRDRGSLNQGNGDAGDDILAEMGGEAAVRRLLTLLNDFDERYIKTKDRSQYGKGKAKSKKKKVKMGHK
ncbi:hypothetical protein SEUCBS139899_006441 [Sporothrix eucalyptigena]